MAGTKISNYGIGDTNLTALMGSTDAQRRGFCSVSLTNYDNSNLPAVAEGSVIEVNGALFEFKADEAIGGAPINGTVYIKVIPAADVCTVEFDNDAPTWDTEKQGWYEPATNNRYLPFRMIKSGADYLDKCELPKYGTPIYGHMADGTPLYSKEISITIANLAVSGSAAHGIALAHTNDRVLSVMARFIVGGFHDIVHYQGAGGAWINTAIFHHQWDDTNLTIARDGNAGAMTYDVFIVYR